MMTSHEPSPQALYLLGFADLSKTTFSQPACPDTLAVDSLSQAALDNSELLRQLRIESLRVGDVLAWYKLIERSEFEGESSATNLADLNWLTPRVLAHEAIVSKLCEYFVLYPARFGCLFSTQSRLISFVARHTAVLQDYFRRVEHRQEWGVKLVADVDAASEQLARRSLNQTPSAGNNYLRLKQLTRQLRPAALERLDQDCQQLVSELEAITPNLVVRTLGHRNSPDRQRVLANVALLLDDHQVEQLRAWCERTEVQENDAMKIEAQLTGPWPAYSFCPSLTDHDLKTRAA